MPEIKPEYPEGQHSLEMVLVEMLIEKRSWNDRQTISNALDVVRRHAKNLIEEQEYLNGAEHTCESKSGEEYESK